MAERVPRDISLLNTEIARLSAEAELLRKAKEGWRGHFHKWATHWATTNKALHDALTRATDAPRADAVVSILDLDGVEANLHAEVESLRAERDEWRRRTYCARTEAMRIAAGIAEKMGGAEIAATLRGATEGADDTPALRAAEVESLRAERDELLRTMREINLEGVKLHDEATARIRRLEEALREGLLEFQWGGNTKARDYSARVVALLAGASGEAEPNPTKAVGVPSARKSDAPETAARRQELQELISLLRSEAHEYRLMPEPHSAADAFESLADALASREDPAE